MKTPIAVAVVLIAAALAAAPATAQAQEGAVVYTEAELDRLLAPVALYPDAVLSNVLIASTYPLQVVAAARWSAANPSLEGDAAMDAVAGFDWDPAVKSLVAFPDLLARMDEDLDWTQRVGDAFLAQEGDVLDRVQVLRERAYSAGNLKTTEQVRVVRAPATQTIVIEPVAERVVYVPVYDTRVVYGPWWHAHPPVHWTWPGRHYTSAGLFWGRGFAFHSAHWFGTLHWHDRHVYYGGDRWHHRPRYHYNRPYNHRPRGEFVSERPRVEQHKPPLRPGATPARDARTRPVIQPHRSAPSRPVTVAPRATDSRPAVRAPARAASTTRAAPAARVAPSAPAVRSAPTVRSAPAAPSRAMSAPRAQAPRVSSPAPSRAAPMSKPAPASAARAPASAPSRPSASSSSRAAPREKRR